MGLWRLAPHSRIFHLYRGGVIRDNLDVKYNRIDGVMVSVLASNMVDRGFAIQLEEAKDKPLVNVHMLSIGITSVVIVMIDSE